MTGTVSKKMTKANTLHIEDLGGALPHFTKAGNIKLGTNMWVWSTMKGAFDESREIKDYGNKLCSGTCGDNCKVCTKSCYVNRSYRYRSVIKGHAINTTWMKENMKKTFNILEGQLKRAKNKPSQVRINQSGEIMSSDELMHWTYLAKDNADTQFYVYTKNYDAVDKVIKAYDNAGFLNEGIPLPENITILISVWHHEGIECYKRHKNNPNIKAFVYDDGTLEIKPTTYCKAYDENGKLDHNITCEKCKKCFNRNKNSKIIGCKAH